MSETISHLALLREFDDSWRGRPARCLLMGQGSGPEGEAVRIVGRAVRDGFSVYYVRSYEPEQGHAEATYRYLRQRFGPLHIREAAGPDAGFHEAMRAKGLVATISAT
jgi:hypothetical protein